MVLRQDALLLTFYLSFSFSLTLEFKMTVFPCGHGNIEQLMMKKDDNFYIKNR